MQFNNMTRWMQGISAYPWSWILRKLTLPLYDRQSSVFLSPASGAGIVISAASSATAKLGSSNMLVLANGTFVAINGSTALPALAGTITQNNFGGWSFFVDSGGTITSNFMNQASTLAGMTFNQFPMGKTFLGFLYANPTGAAFIGGTTALDAASTAVVFVSPSEAFDPWCTIGGALGSE